MDETLRDKIFGMQVWYMDPGEFVPEHLPELRALMEGEEKLDIERIETLAERLRENNPYLFPEKPGEIESSLVVANEKYALIGMRRKTTGDPAIVHPIGASDYVRMPRFVPAVLRHDIREDILEQFRRNRQSDLEGAVKKLFSISDEIEGGDSSETTDIEWKLTDKYKIVADMILDRIENLAQYNVKVSRRLFSFPRKQSGFFRDGTRIDTLAGKIINKIEEYVERHASISEESEDFLRVAQVTSDHISRTLGRFTIADVRRNPNYPTMRLELNKRLYSEYAEEVAAHPYAALVKLADQLHNAKTLPARAEDSERMLSNKISKIIYAVRESLPSLDAQLVEMGLERRDIIHFHLNFHRLFYSLVDEAFRQYELRADLIFSNKETAHTAVARRYLSAADAFRERMETYTDALHMDYIDLLLREGTAEQISQEFRDQETALQSARVSYHDAYTLMQLKRSYYILNRFVEVSDDYHRREVFAQVRRPSQLLKDYQHYHRLATAECSDKVAGMDGLDQGENRAILLERKTILEGLKMDRTLQGISLGDALD